MGDMKGDMKGELKGGAEQIYVREEEPYHEEDITPEMNTGNTYFTAGRLRFSEQERGRRGQYTRNVSQDGSSSWRDRWNQNREQSLERAALNGGERSRSRERRRGRPRRASWARRVERLRPSTSPKSKFGDNVSRLRGAASPGRRTRNHPTNAAIGRITRSSLAQAESSPFFLIDSGQISSTPVNSYPSTSQSQSCFFQHQGDDFDEGEDDESMAQAGSQRLRNVRFSDRENMALVEKVICHFEPLFSELSTKTEMAVRHRLWKEITESVNAVGAYRRSVAHCKKRYQDIKKSIRKKVTLERRHSAISGISGPRPIFLNSYEERLKPYIYKSKSARRREVLDTLMMEDSSDSDFDMHDSPIPSPPSTEEQQDTGHCSQADEDSTTGFPESLEENGEQRHHKVSGERATSPKSGPVLRPRHSSTGGQKSTAKEDKTGKLDERGKKRFLREQIMHRKMLMRKLNALHEDVCHLTQTLASATSVQSSFLERIAGALEEKNRIEMVQQKTLESMNETLHRTCVHLGLSSSGADNSKGQPGQT
ncbi:uncharacterized protein [Hyperolius riggenbachi]